MQGLGFLQAKAGNMTQEEAFRELAQSPSQRFDYLHGRVMKVCLFGDSFDPYLYDRDNGQGAAKRAIDNLDVDALKADVIPR